MASFIIAMRSDTLLMSKAFSVHSSERRIPTPLLSFSFPTQSILQRESLPSIIRADVPRHLIPWRQQRSMLLLNIVSTTSLDLPLQVPTLSEAILNFFWCGVSWVDDLVGPHLNLPTLPWAGNFTLPYTMNLLKTVMFLWLKQNFTAGCPS